MITIATADDKPRQELYPNLRRLTSAEAREVGRRGGVASGEARRRDRQMRDTLRDLLLAPASDREAARALEAVGLPADLQGEMLLALLRRALGGDVEAARFVRDTAGQKPTEAYALSVSDRPVRSLDLSKLSDQELEALAARSQPEALEASDGCHPQLPPASGDRETH